jgi:chemosensory pili system protein ChpA (sensor histidine kinase/response regulator)
MERSSDKVAAGPFTVMVVDDSVSVRQSVLRLVKNNGWLPILATDGVDAAEKLDASRPDAIVLDIEMPRMNGFEFLGILRSQARYQAVPVIMLTSRFSEKHQKKAEELGADHYLIKPYKEDQFVALLQRIASEKT